MQQIVTRSREPRIIQYAEKGAYGGALGVVILACCVAMLIGIGVGFGYSMGYSDRIATAYGEFYAEVDLQARATGQSPIAIINNHKKNNPNKWPSCQ